MVIWTPRARADLKAIHDYIAKDSRQNAQTVAREILRKGDTLAEPPRPGRTVPEVNDPSLREIPAYSWRIIYYLRDHRIFIVTLIHKRRLPGSQDLLPDYEPPSSSP
jgi:plasmid stabilization system protein ParE